MKFVMGLAIGVLVTGLVFFAVLSQQTEAAPVQGTTFTAESLMREARFNSFGGGGYATWYMPRYWNGQDIGVVAIWDMVGDQSFPSRYYICIRDFSWDCNIWR